MTPLDDSKMHLESLLQQDGMLLLPPDTSGLFSASSAADPNMGLQINEHRLVSAYGNNFHHRPETIPEPQNIHCNILELRKEKSRDAARSRRGKENFEFYELAKMLPLPGAITSQLDKASIIRLTISYLKLRDFSCHGDPPWNRDGPPPNKSVKGGPPRRRSVTAVAMEIFEAHQGTHILQSMDGFAFALSNDGRFLYISETVSIYLGLSQVEMTGSSIFEYIHHEDQAEVAEQFGLQAPSHLHHHHCNSTSSAAGSEELGGRAVTPPVCDRAPIMNPSPARGYDRSFCVRMKSTLTKRGVHVKSSGYRVVQVLTHMRPQFSFSLTRKHPPPLLGIVALAIALPPPTINELLIDNDMFVSRMSADLKITYVEPRINDMMDISAEDITSKNLYEYCHAEDLQKLSKAHSDLLGKGQVLTDYYRLMNKHGGYVWIQTCATVLCNNKNQEEQTVIAINYVLSGVEHSNCVMNILQLKTVAPNSDSSCHSDNDAASEEGNKSPVLEKAAKEETHRRGYKRKHSLRDDDVISDLVDDLDQSSSDDPLALVYIRDREMVNGGEGFDESKKGKLTDYKNSQRRKAHQPRKRESRLSEGEDTENTEVKEATPDMDINANVDSAKKETAPPLMSPRPQDLSVKDRPTNNTLETNKWSAEGIVSGIDGHEAPSGSSVRDLEEVMNKHLPVPPVSDQELRGFTDYGSLAFPKHKSTIQWIGSQHQTAAELSATNLLRSLYHNRESVIRSGSSVYQGRGYYPGQDMQGTLLTPPAGDAYAQTAAGKQQNFQPPPAMMPAAYASNSSHLTAAATMTSHPAADGYAMTPPSSVSPQDKYGAPFSAETAQLDAQYRAHYGDNLVKPAPYPLAAHAHSAITSCERPQYASYYGQTGGFNYGHINTQPAHYRDKNANSW